MARLFISHSSRDNVYALAFQSWLAANGWDRDDVFIDLHDIGAGERWRETLRKANAACEAVVLLASPDSLGSLECQKEIELAEALGKEIITAVIRDLAVDDSRLARFSERQFVDLSAFPRDHVEALTWQGQDHRIAFNPAQLAKIKALLSVLGISPGSFAWPPKGGALSGPLRLRRGRRRHLLRPRRRHHGRLDRDPAGAPAPRAASHRDRRRLRRGKSSFLRAGLWPRLKRDPDFAPLAILRPSQGIVTGPDGLGRRIAPFFERHQQPRAAGAIYAPLGSTSRADRALPVGVRRVRPSGSGSDTVAPARAWRTGQLQRGRGMVSDPQGLTPTSSAPTAAARPSAP